MAWVSNIFNINQLLFLYKTASLVLFKPYIKEPSMQKYGAYDMDLEAIVNGTGDDGGVMLYEISPCLARGKGGDEGDTGSVEGGQLIIVTDNQ